MSNRFWKHFAAALALLLYPVIALAEWKLNLQTPNTALGERIYDLHTIITLICVVIFVGVFGAMFWAVFKHRKSVGHKAAQFHENTTVEIIWTIIPAIILIAMAVPATKTLIEMRDASEPDITIKATGYQWKWGYDYLKGEGEGISFYSALSTPRDQIDGGNSEARKKNPNYLLEVDNPLVVPVGKKVRVLTTAQDVLHAWYVPALAVKQDAIPGFIRDAWFKAERPGTYRGQCAELCGKDHGFMPIVVEVMEPERYAAWVGEQKKKIQVASIADSPAKEWTKDDLIARGEKVYKENCVACHQATGMGLPGAFPALSGSKVVIGPAGEQISLVLKGKPGTAMASFARLSDVELAAVITYTRNSWTNKVGDAVMPGDIKASR